MKLQLISNKEQLKLKIACTDNEVEVTYRRCTTTAAQAISRNHQAAGKFDGNAAVMETLQKYIVSWKGVVDENGKELPFSPELVEYLPDEVQGEIVAAVRGVKALNEKAVIEKK